MMDTDYSNNKSCSGGGSDGDWIITRRVFLKASAASVAGLALGSLSCAPLKRNGRRGGTLRFGIVTDVHYADADTIGSRYYRDSLDKLAECVELMNAQKVDFLIELGDFKDQNKPPVEKKTISHLQAVEKVFQRFNGPTYHVLGNHDVDSISKEQFLANVENTGIDPAKSYYSFDSGGVHFVVFDANYKADGADYDHGNFETADTNIAEAELDWLKQDLAAARRAVIGFIHQPLGGPHSSLVKNAPDVRRILEASDGVLVVFQGHRHGGGYGQTNGIHYYTLKAVVEGPGPENNSYAIAEVFPDGGITITGYRKAVSKQLEANHAAIAG